MTAADGATARFHYTVFASGLHDAAAVDQLTTPVRGVLDQLGGRLAAGVDGVDGVDGSVSMVSMSAMSPCCT